MTITKIAGEHLIERTAETILVQGQRVAAVEPLKNGLVRVYCDRGVVTGKPERLLPLALRRQLAYTLMPEVVAPDRTYDPDSTVDPAFKPAPRTPNLSPREQAVLRTFQNAPNLHPDDGDPDIDQKEKERATLVSPMERAVQKQHPGSKPVMATSGDADAYQKYFKGKLKEWGIESPADLDDAQKAKFFDDVDAGWTASDEKKRSAFARRASAKDGLFAISSMANKLADKAVRQGTDWKKGQVYPRKWYSTLEAQLGPLGAPQLKAFDVLFDHFLRIYSDIEGEYAKHYQNLSNVERLMSQVKTRYQLVD
jgi:hypothetical protein